MFLHFCDACLVCKAECELVSCRWMRERGVCVWFTITPLLRLIEWGWRDCSADRRRLRGSLLKKSQHRPAIKARLGVYGAITLKTDKFVSCVMTRVRWLFSEKLLHVYIMQVPHQTFMWSVFFKSDLSDCSHFHFCNTLSEHFTSANGLL